MMEDVDCFPCVDGLTAECFENCPNTAKQLFAYRLLGMILGPRFLVRLQTFLAVPLPDFLAVSFGLGLDTLPPPFAASALPPLYVAPWEPGPVFITVQEEEEIVMPTIRKSVIDISASGDATIVAAQPLLKISVVNIAFTVAGETNLTWKSGSTSISGAMDFGGINEPRGLTHSLGSYPLQTAVGEALILNSSDAVQVSGYITYYLE